MLSAFFMTFLIFGQFTSFRSKIHFTTLNIDHKGDNETGREKLVSTCKHGYMHAYVDIVLH
jgi:hypothetical protein